MSDDSRLRVVAAAMALALVGVAALTLAGPALGAENPGGASITPSTVNESTTETHTFTVQFDNVSKDGNTDRIYVTLPDAVNGSLSPSNVVVRNRTDESGVSISSSKTIVDGPDADGVRETVTFAISPTGGGGVDILVTVTTDVTWPAVDGDTDYPLQVALEDSKYPDVPLTQVASVTVEDTDGSGGSGDSGSGSDDSGTGDAGSGGTGPAVVGDTAAIDPDGDGVYEDVNGDGTVDVVDVQTLFANLDASAVTENQAAFDFNGDGVVDVLDVQALFAQTS